MTQSGSPTVRRRRLAVELRRLRGSQTGTEVSRAIGWSPTKVSRAESGKESLPPPEIEKLIDYYGVTEPLRGQLLALAEDATHRGWWDDYADILTPEYMEFIGLEAEALSCLQWQSDAFPGLLQTEDYARQLNVGFLSVAPTTPPAALERFVEVRMIRQGLLTHDPRLQLSVVIEESVLLRRVGSHSLMRTQLEHASNMADLPNIDLRILPLNREVPLLGPSFVIMSFGLGTGEAAHLGDVVSAENMTTELYIEGETDTYLYRLFFEALARAALSPAESKRLLRSTAEQAWS